MSGSSADEIFVWVSRGVADKARAIGRKAAVFECARDADVSPRRIEAILYREVKRFWADEYLAIKAAYEKWCHEKADRLSAELREIETALARMGTPE